MDVAQCGRNAACSVTSSEEEAVAVVAHMTSSEEEAVAVVAHI
jgi:hypothetical protein